MTMAAKAWVERKTQANREGISIQCKYIACIFNASAFRVARGCDRVAHHQASSSVASVCEPHFIAANLSLPVTVRPLFLKTMTAPSTTRELYDSFVIPTYG